MLVTREQLAVHNAAAKKDSGRTQLEQVYFYKEDNKTIAVATNSYILAEVISENLADDEYPNEEGFTPVVEGFVAGDSAKKALASIKKDHSLPSLNYAQLGKDVLFTTSLSSSNRFAVSDLGDTKFPLYRKVFPENQETPGKVVATVRLDPQLLVKLLEVFKGDKAIDIDLYETDVQKFPVMIHSVDDENTKKTGMIMPLRKDKK